MAKEKERDWDREMREVDKLLAKLPEAEPTLGRGVPTVPVSPRPPVGSVPDSGGFQPTGPARGRAWISTWMRVGLGLALGVGMLVWPYAHAASCCRACTVKPPFPSSVPNAEIHGCRIQEFHRR